MMSYAQDGIRRSPRGRRRALSLIEVIAALLILGGAIASMLTAQSQSLLRLRDARLELRAAHVARELLAVWEVDGVDVSVPDVGAVPGFDDWSWARTSVAVQDDRLGGVTQVHLELRFQERQDRATPWRRSFSWWVVRGGKERG